MWISDLVLPRLGRRAGAALVALAAASAGPIAAQAADAATVLPRNQLNLTSSATLEVGKDWMSLTFGTNREGVEAATVQSQLKQALDAALAEARRIARPGQVEVRTGNFAIGPRYAPKGGVNGWQGSAELVVEGRDMAGIGALAGRVTTLTISRVAYSLSRELQERSEAEVAAQAISRYRAKAADYARQFGYAGYVLGEVGVSSVDASPPPPVPSMRMRAMAAPALSEEPLSVEAGKGTVSVTVSGSVQLTK